MALKFVRKNGAAAKLSDVFAAAPCLKGDGLLLPGFREKLKMVFFEFHSDIHSGSQGVGDKEF